MAVDAAPGLGRMVEGATGLTVFDRVLGRAYAYGQRLLERAAHGDRKVPLRMSGPTPRHTALIEYLVIAAIEGRSRWDAANGQCGKTMRALQELHHGAEGKWQNVSQLRSILGKHPVNSAYGIVNNLIGALGVKELVEASVGECPDVRGMRVSPAMREILRRAGEPSDLRWLCERLRETMWVIEIEDPPPLWPNGVAAYLGFANETTENERLRIVGIWEGPRKGDEMRLGALWPGEWPMQIGAVGCEKTGTAPPTKTSEGGTREHVYDGIVLSEIPTPIENANAHDRKGLIEALAGGVLGGTLRLEECARAQRPNLLWTTLPQDEHPDPHSGDPDAGNAKGKAARKRERRRQREARRHTLFRMIHVQGIASTEPTPGAVNPPEGARHRSEPGQGTAWKDKRGVWVTPHMRWQACGPKWSLRDLRPVRGHMRGLKPGAERSMLIVGGDTNAKNTGPTEGPS